MNFQTNQNFSWMKILSVPSLIVILVMIGVFLLLPLVIDFQWRDALFRLSNLNLWIYFSAICAYFLSFISRGIRWRLLAQNTGELARSNRITPSVFSASLFILLGWFVNSVTWMRIGDPYRAYLFAKNSRANISWSLGILLAERALDTVVVFGILGTSLLFFLWNDSSGDYLILNYIFSIAFSITALMFIILFLMKFFRQKIIQWLPAKIKVFYFRFQQGALGSFKNIPDLLFLSCVGWLLEIFRLYLVVLALGFEMPLLLIPVVALSHALLSVVPTPGGIGAVEAGTTGLLLISMSSTDAISLVLVDRSITLVAVIVFGGFAFMIRNYFELKNKSNGKL